MKPNFLKYELFIGIIICLLYVQTLGFKYTFDDDGLAIRNSMTEKGISAIPEIFASGYRATLTQPHQEFYRPVPKLLHAITWQIAPYRPAVAHALNVLLYMLICLLLFLVLQKLFPQDVRIAFIATLLFAAHPLHVEVVANIKGLDELSASFFILLSVWYAFHDHKRKQWLMFLFFIPALLSKESAVVWSIIIPVTLYFFTSTSWKKLLGITSIYVMLALGYIVLRSSILGDQSFSPEATTNALAAIHDPIIRTVNAIYQLAYLFKNLFLPYPLMTDASLGFFPVIKNTDLRFVIAVVLFGALLYMSFSKLAVKGIYSYLSIYYFLTVVFISNIFFLTGTNYAERLYFLPSLSVCILIPVILIRYFQGDKSRTDTFSFHLNDKAIQVSMLLLVIWGNIDLNRIGDWKNTVTLFTADVETAPETIRIQCYYASAITDPRYLNGLSRLAQEKNIQSGLKAFETAISNHPTFDEAWESIANLYAMTGNYQLADSCYKKAIQLSPLKASYLNNYGNFLFRSKAYETATTYFKKAVQADSTFAPAWCNLGSEMGREGALIGKQADSLISPWNTQLVDSLKATSNQLIQQAIECFKKSAALDSEFEDARKYLVMTSNYLQDRETANKYQPELDRIVKRNRLLANRKLWY